MIYLNDLITRYLSLGRMCRNHRACMCASSLWQVCLQSGSDSEISVAI